MTMIRSVRISIVASVVILAMGAAIGWQDRQRLASSQERNSKAVSQAAELGISSGFAGDKRSRVVTKRTREDPKAEDKRAVEELMVMLDAAEAIEKRDGKADAEYEKFMDRMMLLSPGAAEILIADVMADQEIEAQTRDGILMILAMKLSNERPQAVLRLLPEMSGVLRDKEENQRMRSSLFTTSLGNWGKTDPLAVAEWVKANGTKFPDLINDSVRCGILVGAASRDPELAVKLIDELGIGEKRQAIVSIARAASTAEGRTATLAALRTNLSGLTGDGSMEIMHAAVQELAAGAFKEGFGPASKWLESARFAPLEMMAVGSSIEFHHTKSETGQWLDWLGKNMPPDKAGDPIGRLMGKWTEVDYQSAGKWLAAASEGPAKMISVQVYAGAVSKYEPETAAQWAMTLPFGKDRDSTLRQIYQNWPEDDEAEKQAFAKEHGLK